ncbi:10401_t:CDS:2, partial [Gigaspora margarita]
LPPAASSERADPLPTTCCVHQALCQQGNFATIVGGTFQSYVKRPVWGYITTLHTSLLWCPFFLREERPRAMPSQKDPEWVEEMSSSPTIASGRAWSPEGPSYD